MNKKFLNSLFISVIIFSLESTVLAGTISMLSNSTISISKESNYFRFYGTYQIENKGTDKAFEVFPKLSFGDWSWYGKAEQVSSNSRRTWQIDEKIYFEQIKCRGECIKLGLPLKGVFPVKALVFYKDGAGYPFSTADIINLPFDIVGGMKAEIAKSPGVVLALEKDSKSTYFKVKIHGKTLKKGINYVLLSFLSSKELDILKRRQIVAVDESGKFQTEVRVKNKSGTMGSSYRFITVAEWKEESQGGIYRASVNDSVNLKISPKNQFQSFIKLFLAYLTIGSFAIYYFVYSEKRV